MGKLEIVGVLIKRFHSFEEIGFLLQSKTETLYIFLKKSLSFNIFLMEQVTSFWKQITHTWNVNIQPTISPLWNSYLKWIKILF